MKASGPKQCKETTLSGLIFGERLVVRCQLERGHTGQHIAVGPASNSYALTKWSYKPDEPQP